MANQNPERNLEVAKTQKNEDITWDNTTEYPSFNSIEFATDCTLVQTRIARIAENTGKLSAALQLNFKEQSRVFTDLELLQQCGCDQSEAEMLLSNLTVFTQCEISVDAKNDLARKQMSNLQVLSSELQTCFVPIENFLIQCHEEVLKAYLSHPELKAYAFYWRNKRRLANWSISNAEEQTLATFRQHGPVAWSELYNFISGNLQVKMASLGAVGLAQASGYLRHPKENLRKEAWLGIQEAWTPHRDSAASILNALAGWRLSEYKLRSKEKPIHFIERALFDSRIEPATLTAMMSSLEDARPQMQRALGLLAKCLGKMNLDPWDLQAPSPRQSPDATIPFQEAIDKIRATFAGIEPEAGQFIDTMVNKRWIDAAVRPNKGQGAHCTGFAKSRTPRVFQTYMGTLQDLMTLAHELGHAYHGWVIRDLSLIEQDYPMTLAETASIFAETAVSDVLRKTASPETRFELAWSEVSHLVALLTNIPARYDFERSFYEKRQGGYVAPDELDALMQASWDKWYGSTLTQSEVQFWMTKLHFSIEGVSFYNFPYSFGYLFSLGVYSRRHELGDRFAQVYKDLLRDTGRMTVEEVVLKHMNEDITTKEFWQKSVAIAETKIADLEALLSTH